MAVSLSVLSWWNGFPIAFALTCVIELPAYLVAFVTLGWCRARPSPARPLTIGSALGVGLAVNLITHPVLWRVALDLRSPGPLLLAELAVVLVEGGLVFAVVRRRRGRERATSRLAWSMVVAAGANALSLLVGLLVLPTLLAASR